ncbi:MAG: aminopeptidase P family protein [Tagaea sp.]
MSPDDQKATSCRETYQGDTVLAGLLTKHGARLDVAGVRALLDGVLAAPPAEHAHAWHAMVCAAPSPALAAQLEALKADLAARVSFGLAEGAWRPARVADLRAELVGKGLAGFVLPRGDEHQGEYVSPRNERLAWLTGFTGSAGACAVLTEKAAIFIDGRYTLQVRAQVDGGIFEYRHLVDEPLHEWLAANAPTGGRIGYDPWLHGSDGVERLRAACESAGAELVALDANPIDAIWPGHPAAPLSPMVPHDLRYAGKASGEKRAELAADLRKRKLDAAVISAPDSLAWLLNVRGGDVPHTPLALGFAILSADEPGTVDLFVDERKIPPETRAHLGNAVNLRPPAAFAGALAALGARKARVSTDRLTAAAWIDRTLTQAGAATTRDICPCALPKARKNPVEIAGARAAHVRDGAAMAKFLAFLAREAPSGELDEIAAADRLLEFRRAGENFRDTSFDTISGAGANGAIVHYRATPSTSKRLAPGMLYLVDSGGQYLEGTTDVTRTLAIGAPSAEQKDRFTRVLKGHIALARVRFPKGTSGSQLDALARAPLWDAGLDYDHGTGHGVGSFLSVHEGPQRISKLPNAQALLPGMIVSNEPGYYKTGEYGIRIENLVAVSELPPQPGEERPMLGFETLTLAPIARELIDVGLLTDGERAWLDAYHARVHATIGPLVDAQTRAWLDGACAPLEG